MDFVGFVCRVCLNNVILKVKLSVVRTFNTQNAMIDSQLPKTESPPQKAVSFLPAATQMIYDMGLQEFLHGVTFESSEDSRTEKQILVRCIMEGKDYSSEEIDRIFLASKAQGKSL